MNNLRRYEDGVDLDVFSKELINDLHDYPEKRPDLGIYEFFEQISPVELEALHRFALVAKSQDLEHIHGHISMLTTAVVDDMENGQVLTPSQIELFRDHINMARVYMAMLASYDYLPAIYKDDFDGQAATRAAFHDGSYLVWDWQKTSSINPDSTKVVSSWDLFDACQAMVEDVELAGDSAYRKFLYRKKGGYGLKVAAQFREARATEPVDA